MATSIPRFKSHRTIVGRVRDLKPTSLPGIWDCLNEAWNNIPRQTLQKLIERMPINDNYRENVYFMF